jgi:hypothetical protein
MFIPGQPRFIDDNLMFMFRLLAGSAFYALFRFEDQRHLRAGGHAVASQLFIFEPDLVLFEGRIARLVDWEQVWIDGVALGMAYAFGLFETNLHKVSFFDGFGENPERT